LFKCVDPIKFQARETASALEPADERDVRLRYVSNGQALDEVLGLNSKIAPGLAHAHHLR